MARTITFKMKDNSYTVTPSGVDRKKLYGWTEILALDDDGNECSLVNMDESGTVIIPPKGTGLGTLSAQKKWIPSADIVYKNADGTQAKLNQSTYSAPVELTQTASMEELLDHTIVSFYHLYDVPDELANEIKQKIYTFSYNYMDSYKTQRAFLIESGGKIFMLTGTLSAYEMIGLEEPGAVNEDGDENESADDLDFGSMF